MHVVNVASGEFQFARDLTSDRAALTAAVWSGSGKEFAVANILGKLQVIDFDNGNVRYNSGSKAYLFLRSCTDHKTLLAGTTGSVDRFDFSSMRVETEYRLSNSPVTGVSQSNNGRSLLVSTQDGIIREFEIRDPMNSRIICKSGVPLLSSAFAAEAKLIATATGAAKVGVWKVPDGKQLPQVGHTDEVQCLAFSRISPTLVTASLHEILFWDLRTGACRRRLGLGASAFAFVNDSKRIVVSESQTGKMRIVDCEQGAVVAALANKQLCVRAIAIDGDGLVVVGSDTNRLLMHSFPKEEVARYMKVDTGAVVWEKRLTAASTKAIVIDTKHRRALLCRCDGTIDFTDLETGEHTSRHRDEGGLFFGGVDYLPERQLVAVGSGDGKIRIHALTDWNQVAVLEGDVRPVTCLRFSLDGRSLISGSGTNLYPRRTSKPPQIRVWDTRTWELQKQMDAPCNVTALSVADDGTVATGHADTGIVVWNKGVLL